MKAAILAVLVAVMMVSLCTSQQPAAPGSGGQETGGEGAAPGIPLVPVIQPAIEQITVEGPLTISPEQCRLRDIDGKMLVIYGPGCSECGYVVDKIKEYQLELGTAVEYIDTDAGGIRLEALKISASNPYLPSVIINCRLYTGNMGDRFYKDSMSGL